MVQFEWASYCIYTENRKKERSVYLYMKTLTEKVMTGNILRYVLPTPRPPPPPPPLMLSSFCLHTLVVSLPNHSILVILPTFYSKEP